MSNSTNLPVLKFPHITLAVQNCNSLNISTECDKQLTKIVAITSLCTSIIFLSDIHMGCSSEHSDKISKMFLTNSAKKYQFIFNSSKSSRGVGMLIDNSLSFTVLSVYKCPSKNILGVRLLLDNSPILLISIYGPNDNDISFYSTLLLRYPYNAIMLKVPTSGSFTYRLCWLSFTYHLCWFKLLSVLLLYY
jgi:hypothetical protein